MAQTATTIYLDEDQRKKLFRLAEQRNSSFSSEIRGAVDRHLQESEVSEEEARLLIEQANSSIKGMMASLDDAHRTVRQCLSAAKKARK